MPVLERWKQAVTISSERQLVRVFSISCLIAAVLPAVAQEATGSITGIVRAEDGSLITGAILSYGQTAPSSTQCYGRHDSAVASVATSSIGS